MRNSKICIKFAFLKSNLNFHTIFPFMDNTKYTATDTPLLLPEYGRNVQRMVRYLHTIEDRDLRNEQAKVVVGLMGNLNPNKSDSQEFQHMLWDHLFMIAGLDLDVDSPFEKPSLEHFSPVAQKLEYPSCTITQKQYGRHAAQFARSIAAISEAENMELKQEMALELAKFMRQKSYSYNNEYPDNRIVMNDLRRLSQGELELDPTLLEGTHLYGDKQNKSRTNGKWAKQGGKTGAKGNNNNNNKNKNNNHKTNKH